MVIKLFSILLYFIKHNNIGFFYYFIQKIIIIFQFSLIKKLKYARAIIK